MDRITWKRKCMLVPGMHKSCTHFTLSALKDFVPDARFILRPPVKC
ncbi:hypothetical protein ACFL1N_05585 [Thermodesulfobacteriota bacterium]